MAEGHGEPGRSEAGGGSITGAGGAKGLLKSISQGVRELVVLEEKLTAFSREIDRLQRSVVDLQAKTERMLGILGEMDKRITERFVELDKRLAATDKQVQLQIEFAVRNAIDKQPRPRSGASRGTAPSPRGKG